jgi:hypothetical protein
VGANESIILQPDDIHSLTISPVLAYLQKVGQYIRLHQMNTIWEGSHNIKIWNGAGTDMHGKTGKRVRGHGAEVY